MPKRKRKGAVAKHAAKLPRHNQQQETANTEYASQPIKTASLMGIAGEIRNVIYRYALLEEHDIIVSSTYIEPGILCTSSEIRKEALSIYRLENSFFLHIHDLNLDLQPGHWVLSLDPCYFTLSGKESWSNLKAWLYLYWKSITRQQGGVRVREAPTASEPFPRYFHAFETVEILGRAGVPWPTIAKMLEMYKETSVSDKFIRWDD